MYKKVISFKDSEVELYNYLCKQFSPSAFVKELLKKKMEEENNNCSNNKNNNFNSFKF